jgi:ABC-type branched-subunit amino acid transport system substrate-binding protein
VVKVGLVAPFEGRYRQIGYDTIYAARLAIRELNESGGIDGTMVELVALDDSGDLELARQAAASLVLDPDVVAVVGHWLPQSTEAADAVYAEGELPLLAAGTGPFAEVDPAAYPASFRDAYAAVTPFDEVAGPYAGPAYDALHLIFKGLELAKTTGEINRGSVAGAIEGLQYEGLTGPVYWP